MSTYQSWNFSSVSFQQRASRRFCTSQDAFLFHERMPMVDTFYQDMVEFFCHNGRSIFGILIDTNPKAQSKITPQVLWVREKRYSTVISEECHSPGQKDKYNPWYLKYKILNEN